MNDDRASHSQRPVDSADLGERAGGAERPLEDTGALAARAGSTSERHVVRGARAPGPGDRRAHRHGGRCRIEVVVADTDGRGTARTATPAHQTGRASIPARTTTAHQSEDQRRRPQGSFDRVSPIASAAEYDRCIPNPPTARHVPGIAHAGGAGPQIHGWRRPGNDGRAVGVHKVLPRCLPSPRRRWCRSQTRSGVRPDERTVPQAPFRPR
jgi:hypothetical protein